MVEQRLIYHFKQNAVRELVKECRILLDLFHSQVHPARLIVDDHVRQRVFVILIGQKMKRLEAHTDPEQREIYPFLIFLTLHVVENFLRLLVEE